MSKGSYVHTGKCFQVELANTNSFICVQLNGFKYYYLTLAIEEEKTTLSMWMHT